MYLLWIWSLNLFIWFFTAFFTASEKRHKIHFIYKKKLKNENQPDVRESAEIQQKKKWLLTSLPSRRDKIWTCDLYVPNVALYQAEPHAVMRYGIMELYQKNDFSASRTVLVYHKNKKIQSYFVKIQKKRGHSWRQNSF